MSARYWFLGFIAAAAVACGHHSGSDGDAGGNGTMDDGGGFNGPDAFEAVIDAPPFSGMCTPGSTAQCSDCIDNDADGKIDGFDPECSGPLDRLEDSFATGIPGDNMDATYQDCFFDGDSGGGNDGCSQHVCCLLQAGGATPSTNDDISECMKLAPGSNYNKYQRSKCYAPFGNTPVPSKCTMNCGPLAPPGCDCFGCCTICDSGGCEDLALNPAVSPNCDASNIHDLGPDGVEGTGDDPCRRCVKNMDCGAPECAYDGVSCTPCPGQCNDANMNGTFDAGECNPALPTSCNGTSTCPDGYVECGADGSCAEGTYCSSGCCVGIIL
jgi:hypothetical protein